MLKIIFPKFNENLTKFLKKFPKIILNFMIFHRMVNRKQWKSIARDTYTTPKSIPIANTGIISDMTKRLHRKLESIN